MRKGPVAREVDAWGPIVEQIAATYGYARRGVITEREAESRRVFLRFVLANTTVS